MMIIMNTQTSTTNQMVRMMLMMPMKIMFTACQACSQTQTTTRRSMFSPGTPLMEARDAESGRVINVKTSFKKDVDLGVKKSSGEAATMNEHHVTTYEHYDKSLKSKPLNGFKEVRKCTHISCECKDRLLCGCGIFIVV